MIDWDKILNFEHSHVYYIHMFPFWPYGAKWFTSPRFIKKKAQFVVVEDDAGYQLWYYLLRWYDDWDRELLKIGNFDIV